MGHGETGEERFWMVTEEVAARHYGYEPDQLSQRKRFWANSETVMDKFMGIAYGLKKHRKKVGKVRITFDYDPEYPVALLQVRTAKDSEI